MSQLISLAELKDFLSIKDSNVTEDGRLSNIISQVSSLISSYCGRDFEPRVYTEYHNGGSPSIFLKNPPINQMLELSQFSGGSYSILGNPGLNGEPIASSAQPKQVTTSNISFNTRSKKFGEASAQFNISGHLQANNSDDWNFGVDDFTIEGFVRFNSPTGFIKVTGGSSLGFFGDYHNIAWENNSPAATLDLSLYKFHHIGVESYEGNVRVFVNGNVVASALSNTFIDFGSELKVSGQDMLLDNFKISHKAQYVNGYKVPDYPIAVDSETRLLLKFDNNFDDSSASANQFYFSKDIGEVTLGKQEATGITEAAVFSNYPNAVKATYVGGFLETPDDLKMACMEMAKIIYKGKSGTEKMSLQGESLQTMKLSIDDYPPQVRRILNLYRIVM